MTTFAFDGRLASADTQLNSADTKLRGGATKLHPFKWRDVFGAEHFVVFAMVGFLAPFTSLVRWYMSGAAPENFPVVDDGEDSLFDFIVINAAHGATTSIGVYSSGCHGHAMPFPIPFAAGSGEPYARTAFYLGFDAAVAVRCGIELDAGSGAPMEVFDTHDWVWVKRLKPTSSLTRSLNKACRDGLASKAANDSV